MVGDTVVVGGVVVVVGATVVVVASVDDGGAASLADMGRTATIASTVIPTIAVVTMRAILRTLIGSMKRKGCKRAIACPFY